MSVIEFDGKLIYIYNEDGSPWDEEQEAWFVPKQIVDAISTKNTRKYLQEAINKCIKNLEDSTRVCRISNSNGYRNMRIISAGSLEDFLSSQIAPKAVLLRKKLVDVFQKGKNQSEREREMVELVFVNDGKVVTDSLMVAEAFEKSHDKVLRDIRGLDCSKEFRLANFGESSYTNRQGREMPKFLMTRDGFTFLAMGYTGKKAAAFKEKYIEAFNKMEEELRQIHSGELNAGKPNIRLIEAEAKLHNAVSRRAKMLLHVADNYQDVVGLESRGVAVGKAFALLTGEKLISPKEKVRNLNGHSESEHQQKVTQNVLLLYPLEKQNKTLMKQLRENRSAAIPFLGEAIELINDELGINMDKVGTLEELFDAWLAQAHPDTLVGLMRQARDMDDLEDVYFQFLREELVDRMYSKQ